jgi:calcium-dependent protein kinase
MPPTTTQAQPVHPGATAGVIAGHGNNNAAAANAAAPPPPPLAFPGARNVLDKRPNDPRLEDVYELDEVLGKGAFGVVRLARPKSGKALTGSGSGGRSAASSSSSAAPSSSAAAAPDPPTTPVAVKTISKAKLVCAEDVNDVRTEVAVMSHVGDHRNVVSLKSTHEDESAVHLVVELCKGGELFDAIVQAGSFSERKAAAIFRVMVETLHHCHELGVMHRDLKPENFLLTGPKGASSRTAGGAGATAAATTTTNSSSAGGGRVGSVVDDPEEVARQLKLTDWGLSVFCRPGQRFCDLVGSPFYVAPEVLRKDYGVEADMWSLGVILYILLSGLPPFWGDTEDQIFRMVLKGDPDLRSDPWPSISGEAKDVIRRLLTVDPRKRATAGEILQHPWLQVAHPRRGGAAAAELQDRPFDSAVLSRLRNFAAMNRLKRVALLVVGQALSPEELRGLKELFKSIDRDNSGSITPQELKDALATWEHRIPEHELAQLVAVADVDADGTIDYNEFVAATAHVSRLEREEVLLRAFQALDLDSSGAVDAEELRAALDKFGLADEDANELLASADANGDGKLDFDEFVSLMRQKSTAAALELGAAEVGGVLGGGPTAHPIDAAAAAAEGEDAPLSAAGDGVPSRRRTASTRAQMSAIL